MPAQLSLDLAAPASRVELVPGMFLLAAFASGVADALVDLVDALARVAPFRHMKTPGGLSMSAAMTNTGALGWTSGPGGYRYTAADPETEAPWPAMPSAFAELATRAAETAGFPGFTPDACLVNRYAPGAKMGLHQDRDERDLTAPIVSVSLGLPATFLVGGATRAETPRRVPLAHGDIVVFGGPARLLFHGVATIRAGDHPRLGAFRVNLTFRRAG